MNNNPTLEFNKLDVELNDVMNQAKQNIANLTYLATLVAANVIGGATVENELKRLNEINSNLESKYNELMQRHLTLALIVSICNN